MGKKILILVTRADGHHLEYVEHILKMSSNSGDTFFFCLHPKFKDFESVSNYQADNVIIDYLSSAEVNMSKSRFKYSFKACRLLRNRINYYNVDKVFLIMLMPYCPFILIPKLYNAEISGIVYTLYLYRWKSSSWKKKLYDVSRFWLMSKCKHIKSVFILNDSGATIRFNKIYHTDKFKYLVDPYKPIVNVSSCYNIRSKFEGKIVVSHIGGLKQRKGTYTILQAIEQLSQRDRDRYVFIFGGNAEHQSLFDMYFNNLKSIANIEYYKGFISFDNIAEIVSSSDIILLPYQNTNQSSGVIGYGAQFNVPLVVTGKELLGKLVRKYKLGYLLPDNSTSSIVKFLEKYESGDKMQLCGSKYINSNSVDKFIENININL